MDFPLSSAKFSTKVLPGPNGPTQIDLRQSNYSGVGVDLADWIEWLLAKSRSIEWLPPQNRSTRVFEFLAKSLRVGIRYDR